MRIKLAKRVQKQLPRKRFVVTLTTFVTEEGPAEGTIWFDAEIPNSEPICVERVDIDGNHILFSNGYSETIVAFLRRVRGGRYILIGVRPPAISHTVV